MSTVKASNKEIVEFEEFANDLGIAPVLIASLHECIAQREVMSTQISDLLKSGLSRLATLRDNLQDLSVHTAADESVSAEAASMAAEINSGDGGDCIHELATRLDALTQAVRTPVILAKVQMCRALFDASLQRHLVAADRCRQAAKASELAVLEKWFLVHQQAQLLFEHGREFHDDKALQKSIEILRYGALPLAEESGSEEHRFESLDTLGNVLGIIGQRRSGTRYFEEAIDVFRQMCDLCDVETTPQRWAAAQNGLGNALGLLGQRTAEEELLTESIEVFELALTKREEQLTPDEWASTTNNLAAVLQSLAGRKNDPQMMKRASEAYKSVLRVWTRHTLPQKWAHTMHNLGTALRLLGEHRRGPRTLMQAVAAYNSALAERPRDQFPTEWAMTHNNLGAAQQRLAARENDPALMEQATKSYENALQEYTLENVPMTWAMTTANLGVARRELASMTSDVEAASKAVMEIESAIEVFRSASHAQYMELGEEQLFSALTLRDELLSKNDLEK